jgi:acyl-CoA reductase-like NAD-dependent aldehyde dehydrogenase
MTLEMCKVVAESMGEVKYGAEFFRWFAEEAVRIGGRFTPSPAGTAHHRDQGRSARATRSRRGTSRWPWAPARSGRRSRRAAR